MKHYKIDIPDDFYISEYPKTWMVQLSLNGKRMTKNFSFKRYGGKENAHNQAVIYRDKFIVENKIDLNKRFKKSTTPGVQRTYDKNNDTYYWQASWTENGKQITKRFNEKLLGTEEARLKAIECRDKTINLLNETGQTLFEKPTPNTKIWRYMDFTKFVYMLENNALFFPTIDSFNDPYEGSYSRGNYQKRKFIYSRAKSKNNFDNIIENIKSLRPYIHANCWHMNDFESAGMWKLYSKTNESICIQTEFRKLELALPNNIKLGKVKYINYEKDWISESDIYYPFIYKRLSFEHEKELRAVFNSKDYSQNNRIIKAENGYWVKINLQTLIQRIYVSPEAQDWFVELVERVKNRYKLTLKRVYKSPLNNDPQMIENKDLNMIL